MKILCTITLTIFALTFLICPKLEAQGFAGLGTQAGADFATPQRGTVLIFPKDHGAHSDFRIEWWYVTANLKGEDGQDYGVQWTLFRSALEPGHAPGWQSPQLWMGHAALTSKTAHFVAERRARGGIGQAGAQLDTDRLHVWIDDWQFSGDTQLDRMQLSAKSDAFSYNLDLTAQGPLILHGDRGYSVKSAKGQASYYYSQPSYSVSGVIAGQDGPVRVTGSAWLDREWSSQPLAQDQTGWDWFSLTLDSGDRLMGFQLRSDTEPDYTSATWIDAQGKATALPAGAFQARPLAQSTVAGRQLPTQWQVSLPERGLDLYVTALREDSWMDTSVAYWEGPVTVTGSHNGVGYLEMTGY